MATTNNAVDVGLKGASGSGSFAGNVSPSLTTPSIITSIKDTNGNAVIGITPSTGSVNYTGIQNASTGLGPEISAQGSDTDIPLTILTKGAGVMNFQSLGSSNQFVFKSATSNTTTFSFPIADLQAQIVTWPSSSGTVQLSGASSLITAPGFSQSSSLSVGSAYQNPFGFDVMLTVYYAVSSATTASILLGVGNNNMPSQQTIVSGLTLAALVVITIPIYLPKDYYALLSTSGTITASISGQMAMPI